MRLKAILIFTIFVNLFSANVFADISFSEVFPNTIDDSNLEYIELYNFGNSEMSLSGFVLKDKSEKEFIFSSSDILTAGNKKKYYRPDTKIILNNSSEELFLFNDSGVIIDSFSYSTSTKGEVIKIGENIEDSNGNDNSDNGEEDNDSDIVEIDYEVPDILYGFQSPTYLLEKEDIISTYNCDRSKLECKLNIDLRESFSGDFLESDFLCDVDFGFDTQERNKCNPNTVTIPKGEFDIKLKISNKLSCENEICKFKEYLFKVINNGYLEKEFNTDAKFSSSGKQNTGPVPVVISKPKIIIQSGINKNSECNNIKNCNVNFKYSVNSKFEKCEWDFKTGKYNPGANTSCDPSHVKFGTGFFDISLRVYEKGDYNNYKISHYYFSNGVSDSGINNGGGIDGLSINSINPNPKGSDEFEYIELKNNFDYDFDLSDCYIDDILDGGSLKYMFKEGDILKPKDSKKYFKNETKVNLNNTGDEVNLFCDENLVDKLSWDFNIKEGYILNHTELNISSGKAKVLEVIDGDTLKIEFIDSGKTEKFRLVGIDTPETRHPDKSIERFGYEAYNYVYNNLMGREIEVEIDTNNLRDLYSRLLGFVYIENENFNKKIIEKGYSKVYVKYDFKYIEDFKEAEKVAKENEIGIWGISNSGDLESSNIFSDSKNINSDKLNIGLESIISIQGKVGSNKVLNGNTITCFNTCSINFDGSNSTGNIKNYSWDFGNGEKHIGENPGYIKYENFGNYKVNLLVVSNTGELAISEFHVNYYKKQKTTKKTIIPKVQAGEKYEESKSPTISNYENEVIVQKVYAEDRYIILLYIIIGLFAGILFMLILLKEKLF